MDEVPLLHRQPFLPRINAWQVNALLALLLEEDGIGIRNGPRQHNPFPRHQQGRFQRADPGKAVRNPGPGLQIFRSVFCCKVNAGRPSHRSVSLIQDVTPKLVNHTKTLLFSLQFFVMISQSNLAGYGEYGTPFKKSAQNTAGPRHSSRGPAYSLRPLRYRRIAAAGRSGESAQQSES